MNNYIFKKTSWHYWVATVLGGLKGPYFADPLHKIDGCMYIRTILYGLFKALVCALFIAWEMVSLGYGTLFAYVWIESSIKIQLPVFAVAGLALLAIASASVLILTGVVYASFALVTIMDKRTAAIKIENRESVVTLWYRSVKEKVCFFVQFED